MLFSNFSIYFVLVPVSFIRHSHLPIAHRTLPDQWPVHTYAHMLSKLLPVSSLQNGGWVWEGGSTPFPGCPLLRKIKKLKWIVSLKRSNLARTLTLINYSCCTALMLRTVLVHMRYHCALLQWIMADFNNFWRKISFVVWQIRLKKWHMFLAGLFITVPYYVSYLPFAGVR